MESTFKSNDRKRDASLLDQAYSCFNQRVKNDLDALEIMFRLLVHKKSNLCPFCKGNDIFKENGSRVFFCLNCKKESWFTSNTFFNGIRKPRAYLLAIWLIECGIKFSANTFAKYAKVSYDTAWTILKKLDMLIEGKLNDNCVSVLSSHFRKLFLKRSCETPAKKKPVSEQDELEKNEQAEQSSSNVENSSPDIESTDSEKQLSEVEKQILDLIKKEKCGIDELVEKTNLSVSQIFCTLTMLELADLIKENFGGRFVALSKQKKNNPNSLDSTSKAVIQDIRSFIKISMHGISRRYLQLYLARFWCLTDKASWGHGELLNACISANKIRKKDILKFVSPLLVKIHTPGTKLITSFAV